MRDNKGQALVEFIIVLPILLLIIMAIIDLGNIFVKKYSIENDIDIVSTMYKEEKHDSINSYIKENSLSINYEKEDNFLIISLSKKIKINTPILNNILGKNYEVKVSRAIYE